MRLKRLVCRGFKSFADKTEFDFDSSLTGIIGPNGCGKSNVVDALKWVLGDQRARSLRGKEMTDVIFKGAEGRDALPVADVQIFLEDEEGAFEGRTELSVGRRLSRDKESEYLLNGEPVRLRDVRAAMMDTGLGVGAYSVMEQGRIDAVLSADPQQRRAIFEEAAGISRFKLQKRETLRRLDRTEQNLSRVVDLLEERGRRIRSLKVQAGKARRYQELSRELRELRTGLAVTEGTAVRGEMREREQARVELQQEIEAVEVEQRHAAEALADSEGRIAMLRGDIDEVAERLREARATADAARHRGDAQRARADELRRDAEASVGRQEAAREQHQERLATLDQAFARQEQLRVEHATLGQELEIRRGAVSLCSGDWHGAQEKREAVRGQLLEWMDKKTGVRNEAHAREAEHRAARARERRLLERLGVLDRAALEVEQGLTEGRDALSATRTEIEGLKEREAETHRELEAADRQAAELARRESGLREQLSSVSGRLQVLAEMEQHLEGFDQGPRALLERAPDGLRGRLLDLLEIDIEYGPALEAALGPLVQALVVDTRAHADAMLAWLDEGQRGRALLLVEEEMSQEFAREPVVSLPAGAQLLLKRVRCDERARSLVNWLLRGVCMVDDLAQARADRHDLCFVTREGALLCGPRVEGGRGEGQSGLVVRRAQLRALRDEEAGAKAELEELLSGKQKVATVVDRVRTRSKELALHLDAARTREQEQMGDLRRLEGRVEDLRREHEAAEAERVELCGLATAAYSALGRASLDALLLGRQERRAAEAEERAAAAVADAAARRGAAQEAEQNVRLRQVACATDREALAGTVAVHQRGLQDLAQALEELAVREAEARAGAERAQAEAAACDGEVATVAQQVAELETERDARQADLGDCESERDAARRSLAEVERRRGELSEASTAAVLAVSDLQHRFTRLEDRLREETGIELRRCLGEIRGFGLTADALDGPPAPAGVECLSGPPLPPAWIAVEAGLNRLWEESDFDVAEVRRRAGLLQAQVERLGHVNLDAVAELEEMEESLQFLEQEVEDLKQARRSLMETLRRLETESRTLFEDTFEQARENFQLIFRKLFQGGRADMTLTDGEDSLESGIDIVAKPPGKELQSINLLSGGERSMTALAILFAVFKVKPSPFCILDEVDAALDDTNVERFLRVLRDFVGPTQFCIVTHHKRTMAECQRLYGITMQKRGVSSRMAVSLDQVDSFSDGGRAAAADPEAQRIAGEEQVGF